MMKTGSLGSRIVSESRMTALCHVLRLACLGMEVFVERNHARSWFPGGMQEYFAASWDYPEQILVVDGSWNTKQSRQFAAGHTDLAANCQRHEVFVLSAYSHRVKTQQYERGVSIASWHSDGSFVFSRLLWAWGNDVWHDKGTQRLGGEVEDGGLGFSRSKAITRGIHSGVTHPEGVSFECVSHRHNSRASMSELLTLCMIITVE